MTTLSTIRLAWRLLRRDWRAGELRVLVAALVLAVASVGTVGFFADRVKGALTSQANLLLGADLLISGDRPLPAAFADDATRRGLATTPVIRFNSMVQPRPAAPRRRAGGARRREGRGRRLSVARRRHARRPPAVPRACARRAFRSAARCGPTCASRSASA